MKETYSHLHMEAALCIWECLNEWSQDPTHAQAHAHLQRYRSLHGTVTLRHDSMALADYCLSVYEQLPERAIAGNAYDWEIIPAILSTIVWTEHCYELQPVPVAAHIATQILIEDACPNADR